MSDILIRGMEMPIGGYRTVEIGFDADGYPMALADGGDVYDVIPINVETKDTRGNTKMSVRKWSYDPDKCDGVCCCGDCDYCERCDMPIDETENGINQREFLEELKSILAASCGSDYASYIASDDDFYSEVKRNVEETSAWEGEQYYTDDDIRFAIGRVLMNRLGIEHLY